MKMISAVADFDNIGIAGGRGEVRRVHKASGFERLPNHVRLPPRIRSRLTAKVARSKSFCLRPRRALELPRAPFSALLSIAAIDAARNRACRRFPRRCPAAIARRAWPAGAGRHGGAAT